MTTFDSWLNEACEAQRTAELRALDALGEDNSRVPPFLAQTTHAGRSKKLAAALLAACLVFATAVCAVWPTVSVKLRQGKAYLMTENAGNVTFRQMTFSALPSDCTLGWNPADGYYSCTVQRGAERFTVVQYPLEHKAQIIGDNPDGPATQNDLEGIGQDFCTVSSGAELTQSMLETHSVVSWAADNCYFVCLNDNWTDFAAMLSVLQGIRS